MRSDDISTGTHDAQGGQRPMRRREDRPTAALTPVDVMERPTDIHIHALKASLARDAYRVDPQAVAEALLRRVNLRVEARARAAAPVAPRMRTAS